MIITPLIFMKNIRNVSTGARESMRMWVLSKLIMKILIARAFKRKNGKALNLDIKTGSNIIYVLNQYKKSRKMQQDGVGDAATWKDLIAI